jgi:tetratricopeptide (TPR) repeat protein
MTGRRIATALAAFALAGCAADPADDARTALAEGRGQDAYAAALEWTRGEGADVAEAWILFAETCVATMRTKPGLSAADRAVELAPGDARAHRVKAVLDQRRKRNIAAVASLEEAVRLEPENAGHRALLGLVILGGGMVGTPDYAAAEGAFREALDLDPANAPARYGLGKTLVLSGRADEGAKELGAYLERHPYHGDAAYYRGLARLRARDFDGAEADLRRASAMPPRPAHAFFNLAKVLQASGSSEEAEAMRQRFQLLRPLQMDVETLATNYHSHSDNLKAALELTAVLSRLQRFDEAKSILESICVDNPNLPRPHMMLADASLADHDVKRARPAAERALEIAPSAAAYRLAARAASLAGDTEAGLAHARAAAAEDPGAESSLVLGNLLLDTGAFEEAAAVFENALRTAGQEPRLAGGLGRAMAGAGRGQEAENLLTAALRSRPRNGEWLTARGRAREAQGKKAWAEEDYRTALAVAPHHAGAYDALAQLLHRAGRGTEAKEVEASGREVAARDRSLREARARFHRTPRDASAARAYADELRAVGRETEADHVEGRSAALREEL